MSTQREAAATSIRKPTHRNQEDILKAIRETKVIRDGNKIVLPLDMEYGTAIEALKMQMASEEKVVVVNCEFDMTVPEGAIALYRTLDDLYGFVKMMDIPGFWGDQKPVLINVQTSRNTTETIPWGRFGVPGIQGYIQTSIRWVKDFPYFHLTANVPGKHKGEIQAIADAIRSREDSVYRGKAIKVSFPKLQPGVEPNMDDFFPKFLQLQNIKKEEVIFSQDVSDLVETALYTPLEKTANCRRHKIQLKRGILLEGPYGVGKTLTASVTARLSEENGWTFIHLEDVNKLATTYEFASKHQPAIVFCEDLDQNLKDEEEDEDGRTPTINSILNSIDGIESKGVEIITVLTTNNVDRITKAMLRPGRIDTVVPVRPPDAQAVQRLIRFYAAGKLPSSEDLTKAGILLAGKNAAVVREVVDRSSLSAIRRLPEDQPDAPLVLSARDIELSALGMEAHNKLLEPEPTDTRCDIEKGADTLGRHLLTAVAQLTGAHGTTNGASSSHALPQGQPEPENRSLPSA